MNAQRRMAVNPVEVRDASDGSVVIEGYASTFNQPYDMGWYTETVAPGAFSRTLGRNPDVRFLINHEDLPLARTVSATMELSQDAVGLKVRATLDPSDPDVQRILPKMRRGDLNQMSFGFFIDKSDGQQWNADMTQRTLRNLDLNDGDVSIVTYPANPATSISVARSTDDDEALESAIRELRTRGASRDERDALLLRALGNTQPDAAELELDPTSETDESAVESGEEERTALLATQRRIAQIRDLIGR